MAAEYEVYEKRTKMVSIKMIKYLVPSNYSNNHL